MNERANLQCDNCADCKCNSDPDDDSSPVKDAEEPEVECETLVLPYNNTAANKYFRDANQVSSVDERERPKKKPTGGTVSNSATEVYKKLGLI